METEQSSCSIPGDGNISNNLESKISLYRTSSHQYNSPVIGKFIDFLRQIEQNKNESEEDEAIPTLDLREYGFENIQFQLITECLLTPFTTQLTSIRLKNNEEFDYHCCRCLSEFIKTCAVFENLDFEQIR